MLTHEMVCAWCCLIHAGKTRACRTAMLHSSRCHPSVLVKWFTLRGACLCAGSSSATAGSPPVAVVDARALRLERLVPCNCVCMHGLRMARTEQRALAHARPERMELAMPKHISSLSGSCLAPHHACRRAAEVGRGCVLTALRCSFASHQHSSLRDFVVACTGEYPRLRRLSGEAKPVGLQQQQPARACLLTCLS